VAANLYAASATAEEMQIAGWIDAAEITGCVEPQPGARVVDRECGGVEIGAPPVAGAYMAARDDNLADFVLRRCATVIAANRDVHAVRTAADRKNAVGRCSAVALDPMLRDDARLGGGQMIDENARPRRVRAEELEIAREHGFAPQIDRAQVRELSVRFERRKQPAKDSGNCMQHGDSLAVEPVGELRRAVAPHVVCA
jgi:hypothetical protein